MFSARNAFMAGAAKVTDLYWKYVTLLVKGVNFNGATNSSFYDDGPYKFLPTRNGDVTQGSFSPFGPLVGDAPPQIGGSVYFDGSGDAITAPSGSAFAFGTGDFTIECWFQLTASNAAGNSYLYYGGATPNVLVLQLYQNYVYFKIGGVTIGTSSAVLTTGVWYHVAAVRSGTNLSLYLNGALVASGTSSYNATENTCAIAGTDAASVNFPGNISNFRIVKGTAVYTAAFKPPTAPLTAIAGTSLLTCQSASAITDASSNAFTVTKYGDARAVSDSPFGYGSVYFDGSGDYLTVPAGSSWLFTGDHTIEAWVWPEQTGDQQIFGTGGPGSNDQFGVSPGTGNASVFWCYGLAGGYLTSTAAIPLYTWTHVAVSRSGSTLRAFVNGVQVGSANVGTSSVGSNSVTPRIGQRTDGANTFKGYLSNVRVNSTAAVYTAAFTPPTSPLTAITGTSLLTCQDKGSIVDASSNSFAVTRVGDSKPVGMTPFAQKSAGYWSASFDGTAANYLVLADNPALNMGTGDFTIEFWWYYTSGAGNYYPTPFDKGFTGSGGLLIEVGNGAADILQVFVAGTIVINPTTPLTPNAWQHIALVRSGSTMTLYKNGVAIGSGTSSANLTNSAALTIGQTNNYYTSGGANYITYMTGNLSNYRIVKGSAVYTSAFTPPVAPLTAVAGTSLLTLQDNRFKDASANNLTVTTKGALPVSRFNPFGQTMTAPTVNLTQAGSIYFRPGNADYMTYTYNSAFDLPGDFTIEFWINPLSGMSESAAIVGHRRAGTFTDYADWVIRAQVSAGKIGFGNQISGGYYDMGPLTYGAWSHYAVTRSGTTVRTFCNGNLISTTTDSGTYTNTGTLLVGENAGNGLYYKGYLTDLRIVKGTAVYTAAFTPPTAPLTAISGTSLLIGQAATGTITDASTNALTATLNAAPALNEATPYKRVSTVYGGSGYFDGSGDNLQILSNSALAFPGDYTFEAWIYPTSWPTSLYIPIIRAGGASSGISLSKGYGTNTFIVHSTGVGDMISTNTLPTVNAWTHVAAVRRGTTLSLFFNGVRMATGTNSTSHPADTYYVGSGSSGDGTTGYFPGYISSLRVVKGVAVYDPSALSFTPPVSPVSAVGGTSLLLNFDNASIYDASGQNNIQTRVNTRVDTSIKKYAAGSVYGSRTYNSEFTSLIATGSRTSAFGSGDFTIEMWYYPINTSNAQYLYDARPAGNPTPTDGAYPTIVYDSGVLKWVVNNAVTVQASAGLTQDAWNHVAFSRVSGTLRLFVNGTKLAEGSDSVTYLQGSVTYLMARASLAAPYALMGNIEDLRVSYYGRYTANFSPPNTELPAQ